MARCTNKALFIVKDYSSKGNVRIPHKDATRAVKELTPGALRMLIRLYQKKSDDVFLLETEHKIMNMSMKTAVKAHKELQDKGYMMLEHYPTQDRLYLGLDIVEKELKEQRAYQMGNNP